MSNSQEQQNHVNFNLNEHIGTKGNLFDKMSYRLKNFRKETINPAKEKITEAVSQFHFWQRSILKTLVSGKDLTGKLSF